MSMWIASTTSENDWLKVGLGGSFLALKNHPYL